MLPDHTRPAITVITSFGRPEYDYLRAAGESIIPLNSYATQYGAGVEWLIAVDQPDDDDAEALAHAHPDLSKALYGLPVARRLIANTLGEGPGLARNAALAHVTSDWVYNLDSDDMVNAYALMDMHQQAEAADVAWAAGRSTLISRTGQALPQSLKPDAFASGRVGKNAFYEARLLNGDWPFLTNTILARTEAIRAFGGWADLVRGEDHAMVAVLSSQNEGLWVPVDVHHYRKHADSITADHSWWTENDEGLALIAHFIEQGNTHSADTLAGHR